MLTVTDNALVEIRNLTSQPEVPEGGGLRIATDQATGALTLSLAASPGEGDAVLGDGNARLFLDQQASDLLTDKELEVARDAEGRVQFAVADKPG